MKNTFKIVIFLFTLSIFSTPIYGRDLSEYGMINGVSEEGIVKVDFPLVLVENEIKELLLKEDSVLKKIDFLKLDPITRSLTFKGEINLPDSLLLTMEEKAGDKLRKDHSFDITIIFPSAQLLSASKYVQFKIAKLVLDGVDYSKGFHIISRIVPALLVNRSLINYFVDESKAPTDYQENDLSLKIQNFIENKAIVFRDDTISVQFNLSNFTDLKRFSYLEELRLWHFAPILIKGTKDRIAFRIEAGLGKPGKDWISSAKERQDFDKNKLKEEKAELFKKYAFSAQTSSEIKTIINDLKKRVGLENNKNIRTNREIEDFQNQIISKGRSFLDEKQELFSADPQFAYAHFFKELREQANSSLIEIKQRYVLETQMYDGGIAGNGKPLATKRLSQNAINQFTNFFRDFEFDGEQLFSKLNVVLAPHLPGVVIRGEVNLNINALLEMGLEGSGIEFSTKKLRFDDKTYGKSLPFELSLYTYMQDMNVLELDIKGATLGEGDNRVVLTNNNNKNGDFLEEFTKMAIVNIMKSFMMSDPLGTNQTTEPAPTFDQQREELFKKIMTFRDQVLSINPKSLEKELETLIKIKALELNNPFNETPAQMANQEIVDFFRNILDYDRSTGRVLVRLDPKIFSEKIVDTENNIGIWNFEPLFDKKMDKTFLELAIGDGIRSKKYLEEIETRQENKDSQEFVGTSGNINNEGIVDYHLDLNFTSFELFINKILQDSISANVKETEEKLALDQEGEFSMLEDVMINATNDGSLSLQFTLTSIEKSKKNIFSRIFSSGSNSFNIERSRSRVNAKINLTSVHKKDYEADLLKKSPNEVFLGDSLIKIDLETVGRTIENPGIMGKVLNKMIGNVNLNNSFLGLNLKSLLLKVAGPFLNKRNNENGNTVLGGIHLNQYAKIYTHDKEILIQLNPRFAGPVWDFYIANNMIQKDRKIGIVVDKNSNSISFDFKSAFAMSTVDKIELYKIMNEANEMIANFRGSISKEKLLVLYDKMFYNSDKTKRSLYHRFIGIIENYDDLILISNNTSNQLNERKFNFTSTGSELMQIAITSKALVDVLTHFIERNDIKDGNYQQQMIFIRDEIKKKYYTPMLNIYKNEYATNNQKIVKKKVTDWNYLVYPDAVFSQKAFEYIGNKN